MANTNNVKRNTIKETGYLPKSAVALANKFASQNKVKSQTTKKGK